MMDITAQSSDEEAFRNFGAIEDEGVPQSNLKTTSFNDSLQALRSEIVGALNKFETPFGTRPCIYADWTASGRILSEVETYMAKNVIPLYGNTHTTTSITGHQSTCFRHESRQIIAQAVNAKISGRAADDVVIFVGNGTTAAVNKLVQSLGLHLPIPEEFRHGPESDKYRPVVFTSSYEHHSNLLPWRESIADVVTIEFDSVSGVSLGHLRSQLALYRERLLKIGCFSASSNVTGILTDVDAVSIELHKEGALAFFDYATAAPYIKMDMNPVSLSATTTALPLGLEYQSLSHLAYKDAVFFSGHKFLGGPGCPGVLVAKRKVLPPLTSPPCDSGGGSVFFVTEDHHRFLANREEREEPGTPSLLADVKMGLVMHIQQSIGISNIEAEELRIAQWAREQISSHPNIILLGSSSQYPTQTGKYLPILSVLVRCGNRFLHHNYVSALLNDVFGIQTRGGCACAGPYAHTLLGLSSEDSEAIEAALLDKNELYRPGFVRVSLPYWLSEAECEFVIRAIHFVADNGPTFQHLYRCNPKTGEWAHTSRLTRFPERKWISTFQLKRKSDYPPLGTATSATPGTGGGANETTVISEEDLFSTLPKNLASWGVTSVSQLFERVFDEAEQLLKQIQKHWRSSSRTGVGVGVNESLERLRWFYIAEDTEAAVLSSNSFRVPLLDPILGPIQPHRFLHGASFPSAASHHGLSPGNTVTSSAYGLHRSATKLPAHKSDSSYQKFVPRYLQEVNHSSSHTFPQKSQNGLEIASKVIEETGNGKENDSLIDIVVDESSDSMTDKPASTTLDGSLINTSQNRTKGDENSPAAPAACAWKPLGVSGTRDLSLAKPSMTVKQMNPPKKLMKLVGQAVKDWNMIEEGDRLLLGLSGGKDSLALLHTLLALQKRAPVNFELACATVDPQTTSFDPSPLIPYMKALGVTYHFLSEPIVELAKTKMQGDSLCAFCSRLKRGLLYSCCRTNKYNKLVLAQHLDDLAESFIMSALHNGQVRTMKANYAVEAGDIFVIRPLVYVREKDTRDFSVKSRLPIINENCPACFEQPKERNRVKELLKQEELMLPEMFFKLKRALLPLMHEDTYDVMNRIVSRIESNRAPGGHGDTAEMDEDTGDGDGSEYKKAHNKRRNNVKKEGVVHIVTGSFRKKGNSILVSEIVDGGSDGMEEHVSEPPMKRKASGDAAAHVNEESYADEPVDEQDHYEDDGRSYSTSMICGRIDKNGPPCYELA